MAGTDFQNAVTIEAPSPLIATPSSKAGVSSSVSIGAAVRGVVALVEGSTPHLTGETRDVLRRRLLAAAALFFAGFVAFWVQCLLSPPLMHPPWLFWVHTGVMAVLGLVVAGLSMRRGYSLGGLRLAELIVFGAPALFMLFLNYTLVNITVNHEQVGSPPVIVVPWLLLMFTYALFIPNNWLRAAMVLTPMALVPMAVLAFEHATCDAYNRCLTHPTAWGYEAEHALVMSLALATAVVGVHTINNLRREAFEARQLGQYRLKHKLGGGGMGEVFLAEHQMMKRPCAVKVIRPEKAGDLKTIARFEREVRSTAKLSHWNSIDIYDFGNTADGTFYYVMEYLPGHDLGELVDGKGPLPAERAVYLFEQVCQALSEAHSIGLVHRDLKPANIFCSYRGGQFDVAKLLDFGLAKPTFSGGDDPSLTQEGAITGSPMFMSPEQANGELEVDARSDIYSLGAVMYHAVTGRAPFPYEQAVKVLIAHVSETPAPPSDLNSELPTAVDEIILRCMEKDPDDRFQSVDELRQRLLEVALADPWSSERAAEWWSCHGCPERKAMAKAAIDAAAAGAACEWTAPEGTVSSNSSPTHAEVDLSRPQPANVP